VTANPKDGFGFFPSFEGKTWEMGEDGKYRATPDGDGVVTHRKSVLPGISLDVLSASFEGEDHFRHLTSTAISTCPGTPS
jgi:hypothetical protein